MCRNCHQKMSNDEVCTVMQQKLAEKESSSWHQLSSFLIALSGYNGYDAAFLACQLLEKHADWQVNQEKMDTEERQERHATIEKRRLELEARRDSGVTETELRQLAVQKLHL